MILKLVSTLCHLRGVSFYLLPLEREVFDFLSS
jgi:hypothetical protein